MLNFTINNQHTDVIRTICFNKDERYLLSASYDKSLVVYDIQNNYSVSTKLENFHDDKIRMIKFSNDGEYLLSLGHDGKLKCFAFKHFLEKPFEVL